MVCKMGCGGSIRKALKETCAVEQVDVSYIDTLQEQTHLAFVLGDVSKSELPVVRVQAPDFLRDTLGLKKSASSSLVGSVM